MKYTCGVWGESFRKLPCCQGGYSLTDPKESSKLIYGLILASAQPLTVAAALPGS